MADPASAPVAAIAANGNVNGMVDWAALAAQWASQRDAGMEPRMHMNGATSNNTLPESQKPPQPLHHMPPDTAYRPPPDQMGDKYYSVGPPADQSENLFPVAGYGYNAEQPSASVSVADKPPGEDTSDDIPPGCTREDTVQSVTSVAKPTGITHPAAQTSYHASETSEEDAPPGTEGASEAAKSVEPQVPAVTQEPVPPPVTTGIPTAYPPTGQYPPYYQPCPPTGGYPYYPPHAVGAAPYGSPSYGPPPGHHMPPYPRPYGAPFRGGYNRPSFYRGPGPNNYGPTHHNDSASAWLTPQNDSMATTMASKGPPPFHRENESVAPVASETDQPIDQKNRKQVPLWIRQEIERLEADKLKKMEKERQKNDANEQHKIQIEEEKSVSGNIPTRRYYDVPSSNSSLDEYANKNDKNSRRRSRSSDSRSPPPGPEFDLRDRINEFHRKRSPSPILTEEEKEAKILKRTKVVLTDILLSVTTEEIENVAKEVYTKFKQKEPAKLRRDFRLDYDRSESESKASGKSDSDEENFAESKSFKKSGLEEKLENTNQKSSGETERNNEQSGFSRLSPSIRERFEAKIEDERIESDSIKRKRKKSDSKSRLKTPERKHRNSSQGEENRSCKKRNHSRSRDASRTRTGKKSKKKNPAAHASDSEDNIRERSRSYDKERSRSRDKKRSRSRDKRKSKSRDKERSRSNDKGAKQKAKSNRKSSVESRGRRDDHEDSYEKGTPPSSAHKSEQVKKQSTRQPSDKKRKERSRTPKSESRSRSFDDSKRNKQKSKSEKKKKHKKSSHRQNSSRDYDDERSRSRSKSRSWSHNRGRYSEDELRDSGKKTKKKKK